MDEFKQLDRKVIISALEMWGTDVKYMEVKDNKVYISGVRNGKFQACSYRNCGSNNQINLVEDKI